ncbi:phage baseplate upper protein [Ligilactobacillus salivarius]|uniref:phage baseplate upper protein n=1 Tax=Ligilactobacillus salivarius TaxID=1624 RepID=UPI003F28C7CB
MAQTLKYVIGKDYRPLTVLEAKGGNTFSPDYDKENWVQARQYEDSLRQVFVEITNEDGSAYDLTGANVLFEGILPDNEHKILDNSHVVFYEDPTTGKFRFDMPAQAFSVAGQYKQAFFRVVKDYRNIATLEFKFEVLADIVVTGLVPRDYISPLDDLFNTIKETEIKNVAELKKIVDEKINEITDLMTTLNQTNTATLAELNNAKAALSALEGKIKQDGLFTQGEAEEFKQTILNEFENFKNSINETFDEFLNKISSKISGGSTNSLVKDYNVKGAVGKLKDFANKISKDTGFKILFVTDQHYRVSEYITDPVQGTNYAKAFPLSLSMTNNLAILDDVVDAAVFNGDNVDGAISLNQAYPSDMIAKIIKDNPHETPNVKYAKSINRTLINAARDALPSTDVYINLGNHDDNSIAQKYDGYILDKEDLLDVYEFDSNNFGEERYDFSCYKDYPKSKVRIGIIGAYDNPEIYDGDNSGGGRGNVKYRRGYHSIITQETLNFVKKALETCPDEYTMLWFSHLPLKGYFNGATETVSDADSLPIRVNHELLTGMFSAYVNRRSFSGTGTNQDYPASISVDFTKSKGNIAGIVFGHEHRDKDMQNINGVPGIVRQCFLAASRADGDKFDTIEQYSFDVIELDTNSKQVIFKRFGDGGDTSYGY